MTKPVILTVDDDLEVLQAVVRDLGREYGDRFRVTRTHSGLSALEILRQLKLRNQPVALLLADQRMPQMTGVEFLEQATELFPQAKRALLTAYADTDAAIYAINTVKIHYYLMKPWHPPQEKLYPALNDLLDDWLAYFKPPFEGLRVIGHRWSFASHQLKDFLARNHLPYHWLDVEANEEAHHLLELVNSADSKLPLVLLPDGTHLASPTTLQVAEKVGLKTQAKNPFYDLIIVGAGPAGLAAAVYGASEGLRTVMIEREAPGGQAGTSSRIENYLGFPVGLSGGDLARRAVAQANRFGAEILTPQEVTSVRAEGLYRFVTLADGAELTCHTLIIATGVSYNKLNLPGIDKLTGAGVYYGAAMTEALACQGEDVFVIGAGNSAGQAAVYLSKYTRSVTILVRSDLLTKTMSKYLVDQIEATSNIVVKSRTHVTEVLGKDKLEAIITANSETGKVETICANALFIFIGAKPRTHWLQDVVECDEDGFILTGSDVMRGKMHPRGWTLERDPFLLEASVPGIFAVGDVRHKSVKRVASAVGEGSIAVQFVHQYLTKL
ncbi:fused response regulator/thioredoxin-disulfide reductase [Nostocales cyanobacterium HT-58-2]|nr:fused response regulator/thioredoxin-disulfide reductase [Nostocales cyanobacterium HT-58-2]